MIGQWNRLENTRTALHKYVQLTFDKNEKTQWGENGSSTNGPETTDVHKAKNKLQPMSHILHKV